MTRGRKPEATSQVIQFPQTGPKPVVKGTQLPPSEPSEPDWAALFGTGRALGLVGLSARKVWRTNLPLLMDAGHLAAIDGDLLLDYCVCRARIVECERAISKEGLLIQGARGDLVKNPATTVVAGYRSRIKVLEEQLGLGVLNRLRLPPPIKNDNPNEDLEED